MKMEGWFAVRRVEKVSLLGFLCAYISKLLESPEIIIFGAIFALVFTTAVYMANVWVKKYTGSTTYLSMFVVFFLGVLAGIGGMNNMITAGIIAIITTVFLAARRKTSLSGRYIQRTKK